MLAALQISFIEIQPFEVKNDVQYYKFCPLGINCYLVPAVLKLALDITTVYVQTKMT